MRLARIVHQIAVLLQKLCLLSEFKVENLQLCCCGSTLVDLLPDIMSEHKIQITPVINCVKAAICELQPSCHGAYRVAAGHEHHLLGAIKADHTALIILKFVARAAGSCIY